MSESSAEFVVLGGGIAGLTMAREIARAGRSVVLVEKGTEVGGLSRTFRRDGFSFDLGGHRFHSNNPDVVGWLRELMGDDLLTVKRFSHICLQGRFVDYPIRLGQAVSAFGPVQAARIAASYLAALADGHSGEARTFEDWVARRFGRALYDIYFKPYTEKVWGIPCRELSADWASQRISLPSFTQAVYRAIVPTRNPPPTIVPHFLYPRSGYGTICDRMAADIDRLGGTILTSATVERLQFDREGAEVAVADAGAGRRVRCRLVVSTVPLDALLASLSHDPDVAELTRTTRLAYRGLILVFLAIGRPTVSRDSWTYFPDSDLLFGRSHEPKNWSAAMVPSAGVTSLALEIFASPGEPAWEDSDSHLVERTVADLERVGWVRPGEVLQGWTLRVPYAYPVYHLDYAQSVARVRAVLDRWPGLSLVGRTGSFKYVNVDGIVEDCHRLADALGLPAGSTVQPLARGTGRWI